jgi:dephospho-CoA kinase
MSLIVAVTGGIGSGKSTAASLFQERGAGLIDTDAIAHDLTLMGRPALEQIVGRFGAEYLAEDGSLDRGKLRTRVFSDLEARRDLEDVLHPLIRQEVEVRVRASSAQYTLVLIPLLVETGGYSELVQRVLVVDCDERVQVQRAMQRGQLTEEQVRSIMRAQATRSQRLAVADDVIHNDGTLKELAHQVEALDVRYRTLSGAV